MWRSTAICLFSFYASAALAQEMTAADIIHKAMHHYRGLTSYSEMTMIVHRPDWERSMTLQAWTKGEKRTFVRVVEPGKDAGNGTLAVDGNMWTYTPKINRVIEIPPALMGQSWMGSDFSNLDVSRDASTVDQYDHSLSEQYEQDGHRVFVIQSIPHDDATAVWGKEILWIRDDWVLLEHQFWDRDGALVKTLKTLEIAPMGGRNVATLVRMSNEDKPQEWTELKTLAVEFDLELPANQFTLSNLRDPPQ